MGFELSYYDVLVQHVSQYATNTLPCNYLPYWMLNAVLINFFHL